tara:strand:+ start:912 stop:1706 length:795 start_codon:yes stop_codon:yes gene_type:complete
MSTLNVSTIIPDSGTNTDLDLSGKGTGRPDLQAGFKIGGTAGLPVNNLRTGTDGELITWDASGNPATVPVGTATHILTSNGAGAAPTFQAAAGGGAFSVKASGTASGAATYAFTSITKPVMMYLRNIVPTTDATYLKLETSSDGGSSYDTGASDYAYNNVEMMAGSSNNNGSSGTSNLYIAGQAMYNSGGEVTNCVFTLLNPEDSTRYTALQHWTVTSEYSTYVTFKTWIGGGQRNEVAIVNAFRLTTISGNNFEFDYELLELN